MVLCKWGYRQYIAHWHLTNSDLDIFTRWGIHVDIFSRDFFCIPEDVRHDVMFKLRHTLGCTINCVLLAITHAYKYSWLLKPRYFAGGSEGLSRLKGLLLEDEYRGAEDRAELQGYIGEPLARSTVDASNEGRKYCLPIYNSH